MSVATVAALRVPASLARFSHRAGRRASRAARHPLSVRAVGKDPSPEEEDDLPEPIKLTPEQAKVAALQGSLDAGISTSEGLAEEGQTRSAEAHGARAQLAEARAAAAAAAQERDALGAKLRAIARVELS